MNYLYLRLLNIIIFEEFSFKYFDIFSFFSGLQFVKVWSTICASYFGHLRFMDIGQRSILTLSYSFGCLYLVCKTVLDISNSLLECFSIETYKTACLQSFMI